MLAPAESQDNAKHAILSIYNHDVKLITYRLNLPNDSYIIPCGTPLYQLRVLFDMVQDNAIHSWLAH